MNSISSDKHKKTIRLWSLVLWLLIWQGLSMYIGQEILLVSPVTVIHRLAQLMLKADFWQSVLFSLLRIASGFLLAVISGIVFASLAARFIPAEEFLAPAVLFIKSTPVASFIILVLIWVSSRNLSVVISYLMVLPVIYTNVLEGIKSTDKKLLEMAGVFGIPGHRRFLYIYVSQVLPFFQSACTLGLGLCWKAGVAAEVIGIPKGSIGEKLYMAKIYFATADLFAWTVTVIIVSLLFEKLFMFFIHALIKRLERL